MFYITWAAERCNLRASAAIDNGGRPRHEPCLERHPAGDAHADRDTLTFDLSGGIVTGRRLRC
jgi:hypothetical protein